MTRPQPGAWEKPPREASKGSPRLTLDLSRHLAVDVGGAQLSVFQAQGTACAKVPGPQDWIKAYLKCLSGSPINLYSGFVCLPPQFSRVEGGTVRSWPSMFLPPCKSLSVLRLGSKAWTWRFHLFSEFFSTPFLEKGHDVEAGTLEISCFVCEVWLGAQCGSHCPATVARTALREALSVGVVLLPTPGSAVPGKVLRPHVCIEPAILKLVWSARALLSHCQNDHGSVANRPHASKLGPDFPCDPGNAGSHWTVWAVKFHY